MMEYNKLETADLRKDFGPKPDGVPHAVSIPAPMKGKTDVVRIARWAMAFSRPRLLSILRIYRQALKIPEERPNSHMLNETNSTLSGFRAYPVDQALNIIRAIAEHRWPMTVEEAFSLRDQFGWTPAPDDGRFFVTPVSNGEEDGTISIDERTEFTYQELTLT